MGLLEVTGLWLDCDSIVDSDGLRLWEILNLMNLLKEFEEYASVCVVFATAIEDFVWSTLLLLRAMLEDFVQDNSFAIRFRAVTMLYSSYRRAILFSYLIMFNKSAAASLFCLCFVISFCPGKISSSCLLIICLSSTVSSVFMENYDKFDCSRIRSRML